MSLGRAVLAALLCLVASVLAQAVLQQHVCVYLSIPKGGGTRSVRRACARHDHVNRWAARAQCPKDRWQKCARCQARLREQGLEDEYVLQSWFVGRINAFLRAHGRQLLGWDEILEGGLSPGAIVMSWRVRRLMPRSTPRP